MGEKLLEVRTEASKAGGLVKLTKTDLIPDVAVKTWRHSGNVGGRGAEDVGPKAASFLCES